MKLSVAVERCCGHARCAVVAPEIFVLNDVGYLATPEIIVSGDQEILARRGVRACPERCIEIVADEAQITNLRERTAPI